MTRVRAAVVGIAFAACAVCPFVAASCSGEGASGEAAEPPRAKEESAPGQAEAAPAGEAERDSRLLRATCPPDLSNCRAASGRILYVERIDPDGDGDAHFVLLARAAVTAPGITVVDVRRSLRPSPLPGPGDRLSAAGPVYRGSHGQRQIEAVVLHVARAP